MPASPPQHYYSRMNFRHEYDRIFMATDRGIAANKNSYGCTPETVAISLLSPPIHKLMLSVWEEGKRELSYSTETQRQSDNSDKAPRLDGLICVSDSRHGGCLMPLVSMEARLQAFNWKGHDQSRSNALDAISLCPKGKPVWPLINLKFVIGPNHATAAAYGLTPDSDKSVKRGFLWKSSIGPDALYDAVVAATLAVKDFWERLDDSTLPEPKFCVAKRNLAFQPDERRIFKSYFQLRYRSVNLDLVKEFVDSEAKEVKLGTLNGSFLEMLNVGGALPESLECSSEKLLDIANVVGMLHERGLVHDDLRVSNFILAPDDGGKGILIDFDLACEAGVGTYPRGFTLVPDAKRHPDVESATRGDSGTSSCAEGAPG